MAENADRVDSSYRATLVSQDPLDYFMQHDEEAPRLRVSDVVLRMNQSRKELFAYLIRMATNSKWSHSALVYLVKNPLKGLDNTFLIEAKTKGIILSSWRNEVMPFDTFTMGIKRPKLDWYRESPDEEARHDPYNPEDPPGIGYLQHVRGVAMDQMYGLYDHKVAWELASLYVERIAQRHLSKVPQVAEAAEKLTDLFKKEDAKKVSQAHIMRFICSGLTQYSFFAALRFRLLRDLQIPAHRESALNNLRNMQRVLYREDPDQVMSTYIQSILAGERDLAQPIPDDVLDLLKTATPADFNNSPDLQWRYIILAGRVWQIDEVPTGYIPQSEDEKGVLAMMNPEHRSGDDEQNAVT
ncbi:MAG TPA: hypothetical protein VKR06_34720 [Ktedonosporobacter sp.]|nr:hypothetical protein [Ktedonosporobacter sp.]